MKKIFFYIVICITVLFSCDSLEKPVDVEISHDPLYVVQGYIENGSSPKVILSQSANYESQILLDGSQFINDALVVIHTNTYSDTLQADFYFDEESQFGYNYSSSNMMNVANDEIVSLEVVLADGSLLSAQTTIPEPIVLDSIVIKYDGSLNKNQFISYLTDSPGFGDFYRNTSFQIFKDSLLNDDGPNSIYNDFWFDDDLTDGTSFPFEITLYEFDEGDTLIIATSKLTEVHFDYITSVFGAADANGNPFGQSGAIQSNIEGGTGIFTGISMVRDTVVAVNRDTTIVIP